MKTKSRKNSNLNTVINVCVPQFLIYQDSQNKVTFNRGLKVLLARAKRRNSDALPYLARSNELLNEVVQTIDSTKPQTLLSFDEFVNLTAKLDAISSELDKFCVFAPQQAATVFTLLKAMIRRVRNVFMWSAMDARLGAQFTLTTR